MLLPPVCAQLGGFAFIGEGIPIGLGAAFQIRYRRVRFLHRRNRCRPQHHR